MGMAEYIAKRFIGKEICLELDNNEAETITYADFLALNKEIFQGVVKAVEDGVLELDIPLVGVIPINCEYIKMIWKPGLDWHKIPKGSITGRPITANRR